MRVIVDRIRERELIVDAQTSPPALVVLIGRRRIGKSFLLSQVLDPKRTVFFQADEQPEHQQLGLFAQEAGRVLIESDSLRFGTWDEALSFLTDQAKASPITVVLDEFQWLKAAQPAVDSIIQRHWDKWDHNRIPITLILSGSALTLMENLLAYSAPLYGRASARPRLEPFDYRTAAAFANTDDPEQLLRRWAVIGGTPQYQVWAGTGHIKRIIRDRILTPDSRLYEEPSHLLREGEGIRDPGTYLAILRAIAEGATQYNAIAQAAQLPTGNLVRRLERLEALGYVIRRHPVSLDNEVKRAGYVLSDPYFRFWFRYVVRNRSRLELGRTDEVLNEVMTDLDNVMGTAFEECCREWVGRYADEQITGAPREIGSWWSRDGKVEIDVVGVRDHRHVLVGSCKWRRTAGVEVLESLRRSQDTLGSSAARARAVIFAREGFTKALREQASKEDVLLITAKDLFEETTS